LDHYKDFEEIKTCFRSYGYQTRPEGYLVVNYDDLGLREMFQDYPNSILTYGMDRRADFWATDIRLSHYSADYRLFHKKQFLGNVHLELPGIHNVSNSLASLSLLIALGLDINKLIPAMAEFRGTGRRLEVKLNTQQLLVVDDYAHHPTEIRASLRALKAYGKPLTVVFQPHRFSRIRGLLHEFATAFYDADQLILTDIYGAGETEDGGLKIQDVLEAIQRSGHPNATFIQKAGLLNKLEPAGRPGGELFAFLGAGDIGEVADAFSIRFKG
jgi:UDP-N-acetylmuramate--alanine ligase